MNSLSTNVNAAKPFGKLVLLNYAVHTMGLKYRDKVKLIFTKEVGHDPVIDAVRALSVLSIVSFHIAVGVAQLLDYEKAKAYITSMPPLLQALFHGEKGVDAFFLISALVLGIPLFKKIETFDFSTAIAFYQKRFFRIYPLFVFALVLFCLGQGANFGKEFFANLFFVNNLLPHYSSIIPVGWSLTIEVQLYFLLPFFVLILKKSNFRTLLLAVPILLSIGLTALALLKHPELYQRPMTDLFMAEDRSQFGSNFGNFYYENFACRFGAFCIGLLIAYLRVVRTTQLARIWRSPLTESLLLGLGFVLLLGVIYTPMYDPSSWYYSPFSKELNFGYHLISRQLFAIGLSLVILSCWYGKGPSQYLFKIFSANFWTPISKLAFPIYLFHYIFIMLAAVIVFQSTDPKSITGVTFLQGVLLLAISVALTMLFSIPLHIHIEKKFIDYGRQRWLKRK